MSEKTTEGDIGMVVENVKVVPYLKNIVDEILNSARDRRTLTATAAAITRPKLTTPSSKEFEDSKSRPDVEDDAASRRSVSIANSPHLPIPQTYVEVCQGGHFFGCEGLHTMVGARTPTARAKAAQSPHPPEPLLILGAGALPADNDVPLSIMPVPQGGGGDRQQSTDG